jgi:hypothetical protein
LSTHIEVEIYQATLVVEQKKVTLSLWVAKPFPLVLNAFHFTSRLLPERADLSEMATICKVNRETLITRQEIERLIYKEVIRENESSHVTGLP